MKYSNHKLFRTLSKNEGEALEHIEKNHPQIISTTVIHEAKALAYKNLPEVSEDSFDGYTTSIKGAYSNMQNQVSIILKGGMQKELGSVNLATSNQKINFIETEVKKECDKKSALECDAERINPNYSYRTFKIQQVLLLLYALVECFWIAGGFMQFGDIMLVSLLVGIGLGIAQVTVAARGTQIIKEVRDRVKKRLYMWLMLIGFGVFSLILGMLRYYIAHSGTASDIPFLMLNPFTFAAFNMILILATCLTVYFYYPSRSEMKKLHELEDIKKEIRQANRNINNLNNQRIYLINERELFMELHTQAIHAQSELHKKVCSCYDEAIGRFKHENVTKRTDGHYPQSFKKKHEPLSTPDSDQTLINNNSNK